MEDETPCGSCARMQTELNNFVRTQEGSLPENDIPGHPGQPRDVVVTGVLLAVTIDRMLEEISNPFKVLQILTHRVMTGVQIQIIRGNEPPPNPPGLISEEELLNMPAEDIPSA